MPKRVLIFEIVPDPVPVPVLVFFRARDLDEEVLVVVVGRSFDELVPKGLSIPLPPPLLLPLPVPLPPVLVFEVVLEVVPDNDDVETAAAAVAAVAAAGAGADVAADTVVDADDDVDADVDAGDMPGGGLLGVGVGRLTGTRGWARRSTAGGHLPLRAGKDKITEDRITEGMIRQCKIRRYKIRQRKKRKGKIRQQMKTQQYSYVQINPKVCMVKSVIKNHSYYSNIIILAAVVLWCMALVRTVVRRDSWHTGTGRSAQRSHYRRRLPSPHTERQTVSLGTSRWVIIEEWEGGGERVRGDERR